MKRENGFQYQVIYNKIKEDIQNSIFLPGSLLPPENQIAQEYGVDRSTIRKALKLLVDEGLVEKQAGKGSFVLDPLSSKAESVLQSAVHKNIGFLLPSGNAITQPFYATLFCVLERELKRFGFTLIYSTFNAQDDLKTVVANYDLSGIIFVSNTDSTQIRAALAEGIPCTLVNSYDQNVPSILSDNFTGSYLAGKYLLECGHKKVIILSGVRSYICSSERIAGFKRAYAEAGIAIDDSNILGSDSWEQESGMSVIKKYLQSNKEIPTAIFGLNDRLAFGAMQAIRQCGLSVPDDISVMGYDNLNAQMSVIPLSSIEAHVESLAKAAAQAQIWQLQGGSSFPYRINIPVELVKGETVRKI